MTSKSALFLIMAILCGGCTSYKLVRFVNEKQLESRLPNLNIRIDDSNFAELFPDATEKSFLEKMGTAQPMHFKGIEKRGDILVYKWSVSPVDPNSPGFTEHSRDLVLLIEHTMRDYWLDSKNDLDSPKGDAIWRVTKRQSNVNIGFTILTIGTLGIAPLLGAPNASQTAEVGLELTIKDTAGNTVAHYTSESKKAAYSALWWGNNPYNAIAKRDMSHLSRAAHAMATRDAMEKIRLDLEKDLPAIMKGLK